MMASGHDDDDDTKLPEGWVARMSRKKGKMFYFHKESNKTQWERPEGPATNVLPAKKDPPLWSAITRAMKLGGTDLSQSTNRSFFTPWNHQVDAVYKLITAIKNNLHRQYLIQHSTGTGKSITIACLVEQLLQAKCVDGTQFHTIIVLVDRITLDSQLGHTVESFISRNGFHNIFRADSVQNLSDILGNQKLNEEEDSQKVVITTIHKFSQLMNDAVKCSRLLYHHKASQGTVFQRVAIVTDEAHRSHGIQTRDALDKMLLNLGVGDSKLTYVGFSATPSTGAYELFGEKEQDAAPFHSFTMKDAIAKGLIMNVLSNFKYIRLSVENSVPPAVRNELVNRGLLLAVNDKACQVDRVLRYKAEIIVKDFITRKKAFAMGKCMVAARSREDVVRYHQILSNLLLFDDTCKVYCTFSGTVVVNEEQRDSVSDAQVNLPEVTLENADVIVVCDKLDTGYNEPSLFALYVDRPVSGAKTVQLFSRLNRRTVGKNSCSIIDFVNHPFQVAFDFAQFWTGESILTNKNEALLHNAECIILEILSTEELRDDDTALVKRILVMERDTRKQLINAAKTYRQVRSDHHHSSIISINVINKIITLIENNNSTDAESLELLKIVQCRVSGRVSSETIVFDGSIDPEEHLMNSKKAYAENEFKDDLSVFEASIQLRESLPFDLIKRLRQLDRSIILQSEHVKQFLNHQEVLP